MTSDVSWKAIKEVLIADMPPGGGGKYYPLFCELLLRLEKTEPPYGLAIQMEDARLAYPGALALRKLFRAHKGPGAVTVSYLENMIFIRRSKKWNSDGDPQ